MNRIFTATSALLALLLATPAARSEVRVIASIKPIHSLVASVMGDIGTPGLLVDGAGSPHSYALRPRDAEALQAAQVIFWIGHELEAFLEKPIEALPKEAKIVSLMEAPGVVHLPLRQGSGFDPHHHDDDTEASHAHGDGGEDAHVWLDPQNAIAMVDAIVGALSEADPANAAAYGSNATATRERLAALQGKLAAETTSLNGRSFIVFHDAYQYFERRFGLQAAGAIAVHPDTPPGAKGIRDLQLRLKDAKVVCVFSEPQFDTKLISLITEGSDVKHAVMDPLGASLEPGPLLYDSMMLALAAALKDCLSG